MRQLLPLLDGRNQPKGILEQGIFHILGALGNGYGLIQAGRALAYQKGVLSHWQAPCPVIGVGNLTAGGTGKTPMVAWLGRYFLDRGIPLGVVSRGYRQKSRTPVTVVADGNKIHLSAPQAADEAVLLAQELPGATLLTGPDRRRLIHYATNHSGCRLIIMDDSFQHMQVHRDFNLLLLDARRPWGNGQILPGGLLRESPKAIQRAHGIVLTRADTDVDIPATIAAINHLAPHIPIAQCHHAPWHWIRAGDGKILPLEALQGQKMLAFCGIANPESFRTTLKRLSIHPVDFKTYADHHVVTNAEMRQLETSARRHNADILVTTQKDLVKISNNATDLPIYALAIGIRFPQPPPPWLMEHLDDLANKANPPGGKTPTKR